jgi:hypothetical protein
MVVRGVRYGASRTLAELRVTRTKSISQIHLEATKQSVAVVASKVQDDKAQSTPVSDNPVASETADNKTMEHVVDDIPKIVEHHDSPSSSARVYVPLSDKMTASAVVVTDPLLDGVTFLDSKDSVLIWFDREPIAEVDTDLSDDEEDYMSASSSFSQVSVLFSGKMATSVVPTDPLLDGITFCENKDTTTVWCDREPIPEIDPDFSDDEEDYVSTRSAFKNIVTPSTPVGQRVGTWVANLPIITKKASGVTLSSSAESYDDSAVRSSSESSRTFVESTEFQWRTRSSVPRLCGTCSVASALTTTARSPRRPSLALSFSVSPLSTLTVARLVLTSPHPASLS